MKKEAIDLKGQGGGWYMCIFRGRKRKGGKVEL